ncbi:hypothetical protein OBK04_08925, partial [Empedobacter falsenii]
VRIRINGFSTQLKKENCCIRAILPFPKMIKFYWKLIQIKKTASNFNIETASFLFLIVSWY